MLNLIIRKTKVRFFDIMQLPLEELQVLGIGQINPYCREKYDNELFLTLVSIANESREYDEKEGFGIRHGPGHAVDRDGMLRHPGRRQRRKDRAQRTGGGS